MSTGLSLQVVKTQRSDRLALPPYQRLPVKLLAEIFVHAYRWNSETSH